MPLTDQAQKTGLLSPGAQWLRWVLSHLDDAVMRRRLLADLRRATEEKPRHSDIWWVLAQSIPEAGLQRRYGYIRNVMYSETIRLFQVIGLQSCDNCNDLEWVDEGSQMEDGWFCRVCAGDAWTCPSCELEYGTDSAAYGQVDGEDCCETCYRDSTECSSCGDHVHENNAIYREWRDAYFCESCDPGEAADVMESVTESFQVPHLGNGGAIQNDTPLVLTLAGGEIDDRCWGAIIRYIQQETYQAVNLYNIGDDSYWGKAVGRKWQMTEGNFPKRLSSYLIKEFNLRFSEAVYAHIGNLARQGSAAQTVVTVDFTRRFSEGPEYFANGGSCYWGSYGESLQYLADSGGLGMRLLQYGSGKLDTHSPYGRAWVLPLGETTIRGTGFTGSFRSSIEEDPMKAKSFLVFNPYKPDELPQLIFARLLAQITGKTYVQCTTTVGCYLNNPTNAIVTDPATAELIRDKVVQIS